MKTCKDTFAVSKRLCTYFPFYVACHSSAPTNQQGISLFVEFENSLPYLPPFPHHYLKVCLNVIPPSETKFPKLSDFLVFLDQNVMLQLQLNVCDQSSQRLSQEQ